MHVYLLRHGRAEPRGARYPDDSIRPLTKDGEQRIERIAGALERLDVRYEAILTSPYLRARRTAEIVARVHATETRLVVAPELAPSDSPPEALALLRRYSENHESVLMVGHEPDLSHLAGALCGGDAIELTLKKGGLCKIEARSFGSRATGSLEWLLPPRILLEL